MENSLLHTPEGVRDIYNGECRRKQEILARLNRVIRTFGFQQIQTPTFEFFDIFSKEVGTTPSRELYKFFDREGNTLVLRPDITPSIARAAAKYFSEEKVPIRLSYQGNVFINHQVYQGRPKESTQIGAELLGENSLDADSEIIAVIVQCLRAAGLKNFQISISHVDILRGLMKAAGLSEEEERQVKNLIANKNFYGVDEFLDTNNRSRQICHLFQCLSQMYSSPEEWRDLMELFAEVPTVHKALCYLQKLHELLVEYGVDAYVSYEPGMMQDYGYYTGIIFSGYTFGTGEPMVKGGRYDSLLSYFGKESPAIGFAIMADQLLLALERQKIPVEIAGEQEAILYTRHHRKAAIQKATALRRREKEVTLVRLPEDADEREAVIHAWSHASLTILDGE